ncbi:MAG TPA: hypothetical protein DEA96_09590 [Leptospiraceae bacterium]|nr:hypothetical protein [Spirochaetaceae bacterium]HBS05206.1 hypothetical protein [Leptospiraceae bacterium]
MIFRFPVAIPFFASCLRYYILRNLKLPLEPYPGIDLNQGAAVRIWLKYLEKIARLVTREQPNTLRTHLEPVII